MLAAGPQTGERGAREVVATDGHPFWVNDEGRWVDAGDLKVGDNVLTSDGDRAEVIGTSITVRVQKVHNLTIDGINTYNVVVGNTDVLVHNTGPGCGPDSYAGVRAASDFAQDRGCAAEVS